MGSTIHGTVCEEAVGRPSKVGGTMSTQTDSVRVEVPAKAPVQPTAPRERMDRRAWDRIVSSAGAVLAVILLVLGGAAI